jgi:hypothetical protein
MKNLFGWFVGLATVTVLAGCGGDSGGTCANTPGCGGDIVGTWKVTSSCLSIDASALLEGLDCAGATASATGFKITGTVAYSADMTYSTNTTLTGSIVTTIPPACLKVEGFTLTCAQLQQALQPSGADSDYSSVTCTGSSSCTCTMVLAPQTSTATGTYTTTAAGVLTESEGAGTPAQSDYCVKGTTLTVSPRDTSGMMGQPGITGTVTATKQ